MGPLSTKINGTTFKRSYFSKILTYILHGGSQEFILLHQHNTVPPEKWDYVVA